MSEQEQQLTRRRRSAFVRGDKLSSLRPSPRDAEIVQYVHDFRFLTAKHLIALTGGNKTSVEKRLFKLWQHEYLERRWDTAHGALQRGPAIYQLARKGAELLAQVSGKDPGQLDWSARRNDVKQPFMQHALMISQIRAAFTLAARQCEDVTLAFWRHDQDTSDRVAIGNDPIYNGVRTETWPVVPDGYFGLALAGNKGYHCMLEADRSTMDHKDFLRKLRAYFLWWKTSGHTKKFNIPHFIVLTVTLTPERAKNLFELSREADDKKNGCALFWFTTIDKCRLDQPGRILEDVWATWSNGQPTRVAFVK